MDDDGFVEAIVGLVERHPALYYQMELEESHVQFHVVKRDFFGDAFLEVFRQYNNALFDSVRLMIRYEKSLKAWREIVAGVDDKLKSTLIMDYVHPVFAVACDLPNVFKDQLVCGCVKLATVAKGDFGKADGTGSAQCRRRAAIRRLERNCAMLLTSIYTEALTRPISGSYMALVCMTCRRA